MFEIQKKLLDKLPCQFMQSFRDTENLLTALCSNPCLSGVNLPVLVLRPQGLPNAEITCVAFGAGFAQAKHVTND